MAFRFVSVIFPLFRLFLLKIGYFTLFSKFHEIQALLVFSSVQSLSCVRLFATPWTAAHQASLSITNSQFTQTHAHWVGDAIQPSHPLSSPFLSPSIFPSIRVFSNKSALRIRWPNYWSFSFNISPSRLIQDWSPLGWTGWISLQSKGLSRVFSNTTVQKHQFFSVQLTL